MANTDFYLQGTDEQAPAKGADSIRVYEGVIDLEVLLASEDLTSADVIRLVEFEADTYFLGAALANITALDLDSGSADAIDFGNTISSASDPDDYVDNSSNEATTAYSYAAAAYTPAFLTSDGYFAIRLTGDKITDGTATGKIGWKVAVMTPAKFAKGYASYRNYPND